MKSEDAIHRSFCAAYTQAVLCYLREGINWDVVFDAETQSFRAVPIAASVPPAHCEWWVGSDWPSFVGPLSCHTEPKHAQFSEKLLSNEIIFALAKSPTGKRMSRILAGLD